MRRDLSAPQQGRAPQGGGHKRITAWGFAGTPIPSRCARWDQYEVLQEGPGISSMQTRRAVVSGSVGDDARWPRFGARVAPLGVASVLSLPLPIDDLVVGSITAYAHGPDAFGQHAVQLGSAFARPAAVSAYNTQLVVRARERAEHLQRALDSRGVIDQAMGLIRGRSGCSSEEAFVRLRRMSMVENTKLHMIAQRLVDEAVRRAAERNGLL